MQIDILLQDPRGDEIGTLNLEAVRLAVAGMETARPDLSGQMAQLIARLSEALTRLGFSPVLDPLGVRIAVSKALLGAPPGGVSIPLQVQALCASQAVRTPEPAYSPISGAVFAPAAGSPPADDWQDMFALSPEETENTQTPVPPMSSSTNLTADQKPLGNWEAPGHREPFDQWTALGDLWTMDDEGGKL